MEALVAMTILLCIFAIGEVVAVKTKALMSAMLVGALILLVGFWLGLDKNIMEVAGITTNSSIFIGLLLTSMGTLIDLKELLNQWKTALIGFSAAVFIVIIIILVGPVIIDRSQSIASSSIVAGGVVANLVIQETIKGKGLLDVEVLCVLVLILQSLVGIPITSIVLRKEAKRFIASKEYIDKDIKQSTNNIKESKKLIPELPKAYSKPTIILAKVALVTLLANVLSNFTNGQINSLLMCMILGVISCSIGFLEKDVLTKANSFGIVMFYITAFIFANLHQATPEVIIDLIVPVVVVLSLGIVGVVISGLLMSKLLKVKPLMAIAIGLTALYGFPATFYLANEVAEGIGETKEEVEAIRNYMVPKMVTAGFATVTIASVLIVGFVSKMI